MSLYQNIHHKRKSVILEEQQKLLSSVLSKYWLLSFIAIISTQIVTLTLSFGWIYAISNRHNTNEFSDYVGVFQTFFHFTTPMDIIINSICLLLILDDTVHIYFRFCYRFHSCVQLCFYQWIKRRASKTDYKLTDTELQVVLLDDSL